MQIFTLGESSKSTQHLQGTGGINDVEVAMRMESGELRVKVRTLGPAAPSRISKARS